MLIDLAIAVFVGVIISALVFAWQQGKKIELETSVDEKGFKYYKLKGALFFGSVSSFKDLFDIKGDPENIVINFKYARVYDHSGLEAINNIAERYDQHNKKLHLLNLSPECQQLLEKAENIVEVSIINDLKNWHLAENKLA